MGQQHVVTDRREQVDAIPLTAAEQKLLKNVVKTIGNATPDVATVTNVAALFNRPREFIARRLAEELAQSRRKPLPELPMSPPATPDPVATATQQHQQPHDLQQRLLEDNQHRSYQKQQQHVL